MPHPQPGFQRWLHRLARVVGFLAAAHLFGFVATRWWFFPEPPLAGWLTLAFCLGWAICAVAMSPVQRWAWWGSLVFSIVVCAVALPLFLALALPLLFGAPYFFLAMAVLLPSSVYLLLATRPDP